MNYIIEADVIEIGRNVIIEDGVFIGGKHGKKLKRLIIGDCVFIGKNSKFYYNDYFEIGDYTSIQNSCFGSGDKGVKIGSCCWFGQNCIIDGEEESLIGNGVGVGAYSQLWSHILFGDTLQGCRFDSRKKLIIGDDVWFVGHCIVSPINAEEKSMALAGSVVTKDMAYNEIYAGVPAKSISKSAGFQYEERTIEEKALDLNNKLKEFYDLYPDYLKEISIKIVLYKHEIIDNASNSYFVINDRKYTKRFTKQEIDFMKFLLVKIKFYPY